MDNIVQLNNRRKDGFHRHCMLCPRCYIRERFERTHNSAMFPYVLIASTPDGVEVLG